MSKPKKQTDDEILETQETGTASAPNGEAGDETAAAEPSPTGEEAGPEEEAAEPAQDDDPLAILEAERDSFQEKWLRAVAEMENVRKRSRKELLDSRRFAEADLLRPMLEVHDNFERALQSFGEDIDTDAGQSLREGVELIFQKFRSVLKERGVEAIEALEREFDPRVHEAVGQLPREGVEAGTVIEVVQPGYTLGGDFVLRPARVIVAQ